MKKNIIILSAIAISLFIITKVFSNSDKEEIGALLSELENSLEYDKPLAPLAVNSRLGRLKKVFAENFDAKYVGFSSVRSLENPEAIKGKAFMAAQYFSYIDILRLPSSIDIMNDQAKVSFQVTISGEDKQGVSFKELFDIKMELSKLDEQWLCTSIIASRLTPEDS